MTTEIPTYEELAEKSKNLGESIKDHLKEEWTVFSVDDQTDADGKYDGTVFTVRCSHTDPAPDDRTMIYTRSAVLLKEMKKHALVSDRMRKHQPFTLRVKSIKNYYVPDV